MVPGIVITHPVNHEFTKILWILIPHPYGPFQSGFQTLIIKVIKHIAVTFMIWSLRAIRIKDSICQAAGIADNWNSPVFHGDHLRQAARFKRAGYKNHIRTCVNQMGQFLIIRNFKVAVRIIIQIVFQSPEVVVCSRIRTRSQQDELAALCQRIKHAMFY